MLSAPLGRRKQMSHWRDSFSNDYGIGIGFIPIVYETIDHPFINSNGQATLGSPTPLGIHTGDVITVNKMKDM